jgi:averantin hydroxylase
MAGGSETSSSALAAITYFLLHNPSTMEKLKEEVRSTFKSESEINIAGVQGLKYILAVIYEGLRMFPPLPGSMRRIVGPGGREIAGFFIPEGTLVAVDEFSAGRYSGNFARPLDFCRERYLENPDPEFAADRPKAIRPFSAGPRDCLGKSLALAEMRIVLARILFNFDLELVEPEKKDWIETMPAFTFWEKTPLMVKLTPVSF